MKKNLQIFSYLLVTFLVLICCAGYAVAQSDKAVLRAASVSGNKGDIIEVSIDISDCPAANGFEINLKIDSSKLEYQGYTAGDAAKKMSFAMPNFKDNTFIYVGVSMAPVQFDGNIATVKLKVLSDTKETVMLTFSKSSIIDGNGKDIECTVVNSTIALNGAAGQVVTPAVTTIGSDTVTTQPSDSHGHSEKTTGGTSSKESMGTSSESAGESGETTADSNVFKVICSSSPGGSVDPTVKFVDPGDSVNLLFIPDEGYRLASVTINGEIIEGIDTEYDLNDIRKDYEVYAAFEESGDMTDKENPSESSGESTDENGGLSTGQKVLLVVLVVLTVAAGIAITIFNVKKSAQKIEDTEISLENENPDNENEEKTE